MNFYFVIREDCTGMPQMNRNNKFLERMLRDDDLSEMFIQVKSSLISHVGLHINWKHHLQSKYNFEDVEGSARVLKIFGCDM